MLAMAVEAAILLEERDAVAAYVEIEFHGLHEGDTIRYKKPYASLTGFDREPEPTSTACRSRRSGIP